MLDLRQGQEGEEEQRVFLLSAIGLHLELSSKVYLLITQPSLSWSWDTSHQPRIHLVF